jgi:hypothetical protein
MSEENSTAYQPSDVEGKWLAAWIEQGAFR